VVRDLVQHDPPHLGSEQVGVAAGHSLQRALVDRDLVRRHARVGARPACEWDTLVEAQQRQSGRGLVLDDHRDVGHEPAQVVRKRGDRSFDEVFELRHADSIA
jgi:hypothetical protein